MAVITIGYKGKYYKEGSEYFLYWTVSGLEYLKAFEFDLLITEHSIHSKKFQNFGNNIVFMFL